MPRFLAFQPLGKEAREWHLPPQTNRHTVRTMTRWERSCGSQNAGRDIVEVGVGVRVGVGVGVGAGVGVGVGAGVGLGLVLVLGLGLVWVLGLGLELELRLGLGDYGEMASWSSGIPVSTGTVPSALQL
jgi:hypothetical protein